MVRVEGRAHHTAGQKIGKQCCKTLGINQGIK